MERDWASRIDPGAAEFDVHAGRPSPHRDALTARIEMKLQGSRYAALLAQAADLEQAIAEG